MGLAKVAVLQFRDSVHKIDAQFDLTKAKERLLKGILSGFQGEGSWPLSKRFPPVLGEAFASRWPLKDRKGWLATLGLTMKGRLKADQLSSIHSQLCEGKCGVPSVNIYQYIYIYVYIYI